MTLEQVVAQFVVDFDSRHIDAAVRERAKALIKDQFAIQIGVAQLPWSRQVRSIRDPRPGKATIAADGVKAAAADAAYLNATYGHGFEYDDYFDTGHPGCCVVPAAFAVGEEVGATLEEVLVAMVAGFEVYARIGRLASPELLLAGWQPHAVLANFGAAAIAAKLHRLDAQRTLHALAIALSHAGGTTEYASTGGSIKRVHAGIGVRNGIESAALAHAGITGPLRFLSGARGLFRTFVRKTVGDEASGAFALDAPLALREVSFKAYCCCAITHPFIEAMGRVRARAGDIVGIDARIQTMADSVVGSRNANIYQPRNIEELQYALPMQMALSVLGKGNGYKTHRSFLEGRLDLSPDSDVVRLARTIELTVDRELDERYPLTFVADLMVRYRDGSSERVFQDQAKGRPTSPFTPQEHQAKLDELTDEVIGKGQADRLFALVDRMPADMPATEVAALLARR
ncbi:MAG: MmgE/PrpD family protein [Burkholderiales bacterium]|nr:MmgE/PrpD family protein [Burkholderiales bacterium]